MKNWLMILLVFMSFTVNAGIKCSDVTYGTENYIDNMEKLAKQARLPDDYFNRYHEDVVSALCEGNNKDIKDLIDNGFVKSSEVEAIKEVLGKNKRSEEGKSYGYSKEKFLAMGLYPIIADNVAQFYTKKPNSKCGKLAKQALEGNPDAISELQSDPSYCTWKY